MVRLSEEEMYLVNRVFSLFSVAHEDLRESEQSVNGLIKASYVLGRIGELLDGQPGRVMQRVIEEWNEAVVLFNAQARRHGATFKLHALRLT